MSKTLFVSLIAAILASAAFAAAPAQASKTQESIFQDDRTLIFSGDAKRQEALDEMKALGATTIHSLVFWNSIAPDPNSKTKPAGFDGSDPSAYPPGAWDQYDALVREATARGLQVLFSPVESPAWAGGCGGINLRHHCEPNAAEFGAFVAALGKRYSGSFGGLPRVARSDPPGAFAAPPRVRAGSLGKPGRPAAGRRALRQRPSRQSCRSTSRSSASSRPRRTGSSACRWRARRCGSTSPTTSPIAIR